MCRLSCLRVAGGAAYRLRIRLRYVSRLRCRRAVLRGCCASSRPGIPPARRPRVPRKSYHNNATGGKLTRGPIQATRPRPRQTGSASRTGRSASRRLWAVYPAPGRSPGTGTGTTPGGDGSQPHRCRCSACSAPVLRLFCGSVAAPSAPSEKNLQKKFFAIDRYYILVYSMYCRRTRRR